MFTENPIDDLLELADELKGYERRYDMSSEDFGTRFQRGELGDDMDFIGWAGAYDLFHNRKRQYHPELPGFSEHQHVSGQEQPAPASDLTDVLRDAMRDAILYPQGR